MLPVSPNEGDPKEPTRNHKKDNLANCRTTHSRKYYHTSPTSYATEQSIMEPTENQIIVYQPNGVMKIDVRFDGETVWLLQAQIAELFSCSLENVRLHLKNIYACGELEETATSKESLEVRKEAGVAPLDMLAKRWRGAKIKFADLKSQIATSTIDVREAA